MNSRLHKSYKFNPSSSSFKHQKSSKGRPTYTQVTPEIKRRRKKRAGSTNSKQSSAGADRASVGILRNSSSQNLKTAKKVFKGPQGKLSELKRFVNNTPEEGSYAGHYQRSRERKRRRNQSAKSSKGSRRSHHNSSHTVSKNGSARRNRYRLSRSNSRKGLKMVPNELRTSKKRSSEDQKNISKSSQFLHRTDKPGRYEDPRRTEIDEINKMYALSFSDLPVSEKKKRLKEMLRSGFPAGDDDNERQGSSSDRGMYKNGVKIDYADEIEEDRVRSPKRLRRKDRRSSNTRGSKERSGKKKIGQRRSTSKKQRGSNNKRSLDSASAGDSLYKIENNKIKFQEKELKKRLKKYDRIMKRGSDELIPYPKSTEQDLDYDDYDRNKNNRDGRNERRKGHQHQKERKDEERREHSRGHHKKRNSSQAGQSRSRKSQRSDSEPEDEPDREMNAIFKEFLLGGHGRQKRSNSKKERPSYFRDEPKRSKASPERKRSRKSRGRAVGKDDDSEERNLHRGSYGAALISGEKNEHDFYSKYEVLTNYDSIVKRLKLPKLYFAFRPKTWNITKLLNSVDKILDQRAEIQRDIFRFKKHREVPKIPEIYDITGFILFYYKEKHPRSHNRMEKELLELLWSLENHKSSNIYIDFFSRILTYNYTSNDLLFFLMAREHVIQKLKKILGTPNYNHEEMSKRYFNTKQCLKQIKNIVMMYKDEEIEAFFVDEFFGNLGNGSHILIHEFLISVTDIYHSMIDKGLEPKIRKIRYKPNITPKKKGNYYPFGSIYDNQTYKRLVNQGELGSASGALQDRKKGVSPVKKNVEWYLWSDYNKLNSPVSKGGIVRVEDEYFGERYLKMRARKEEEAERRRRGYGESLEGQGSSSSPIRDLLTVYNRKMANQPGSASKASVEAASYGAGSDPQSLSPPLEFIDSSRRERGFGSLESSERSSLNNKNKLYAFSHSYQSSDRNNHHQNQRRRERDGGDREGSNSRKSAGNYFEAVESGRPRQRSRDLKPVVEEKQLDPRKSSKGSSSNFRDREAAGMPRPHPGARRPRHINPNNTAMHSDGDSNENFSFSSQRADRQEREKVMQLRGLLPPETSPDNIQEFSFTPRDHQTQENSVQAKDGRLLSDELSQEFTDSRRHPSLLKNSSSNYLLVRRDGSSLNTNQTNSLATKEVLKKGSPLVSNFEESITSDMNQNSPDLGDLRSIRRAARLKAQQRNQRASEGQFGRVKVEVPVGVDFNRRHLSEVVKSDEDNDFLLFNIFDSINYKNDDLSVKEIRPELRPIPEAAEEEGTGASGTGAYRTASLMSLTKSNFRSKEDDDEFKDRNLDGYDNDRLFGTLESEGPRGGAVSGERGKMNFLGSKTMSVGRYSIEYKDVALLTSNSAVNSNGHNRISMNSVPSLARSSQPKNNIREQHEDPHTNQNPEITKPSSKDLKKHEIGGSPLRNSRNSIRKQKSMRFYRRFHRVLKKSLTQLCSDYVDSKIPDSVTNPKTTKYRKEQLMKAMVQKIDLLLVALDDGSIDSWFGLLQISKNDSVERDHFDKILKLFRRLQDTIDLNFVNQRVVKEFCVHIFNVPTLKFRFSDLIRVMHYDYTSQYEYQ